MSKPVKEMLTQEYRRRYAGVEGACLVSVIGLDAVSTNRLRRELKAANIRLQVIKNSLARRAFTGTPLEPLGSALEGACAMVTGGESVIDVAKILVAAKKNYPKMELRVGMLDGDTELIAIERLASFRNRTELLRELAALIASPGRRLAGCLRGPGGRIAGCVQAMIDKAPGEGSAQAEAVEAGA